MVIDKHAPKETQISVRCYSDVVYITDQTPPLVPMLSQLTLNADMYVAH